ncbi:MAG: hypothetical protein ABI273_11735, partial [Lacunisphaera sp.]
VNNPGEAPRHLTKLFMLQNPASSILEAAVVRQPFRPAQDPELVEGLVSGVTTAATTKPKPSGSAHGRRQASRYRPHHE